MSDALKTIEALSSSRAQLVIHRAREFTLMCQTYNLPGMALNPAETPTPHIMRPEPGDRMTFEPLSVEFQMDRRLEGWQEIQNWMLSLVDPQEKVNSLASGPDRFADATLIILTNKNNPAMKIKFYDLWPSSLGAVNFTQEDSETVYLKCNVEFQYLIYEFEK